MTSYCGLLQEANEETVHQASTAAQLASQIDELHSHRVSWLCAMCALCCTAAALDRGCPLLVTVACAVCPAGHIAARPL